MDLVAGLAESQRGRLVVEAVGPEARLTIPRNAFLQVARSLLQNAFDAGPGPVRLGLEAIEGRLRLRIEDEGVGMSKDQLARAGEPFFSTKPPGQGLGLGLFIARSLSEQMGGSSASAPPPARARSRSSRSGRCGRLREPRLPSDQVEGRSLFIVEDDDGPALPPGAGPSGSAGSRSAKRSDAARRAQRSAVYRSPGAARSWTSAWPGNSASGLDLVSVLRQARSGYPHRGADGLWERGDRARGGQAGAQCIT